MFDFTSTGLILIALNVLCILTISSYLSIKTFFETEVMNLKILFSNGLMNISALASFPYVLNTFLHHFSAMVSLMYYKIHRF